MPSQDGNNLIAQRCTSSDRIAPSKSFFSGSRVVIDWMYNQTINTFPVKRRRRSSAEVAALLSALSRAGRACAIIAASTKCRFTLFPVASPSCGQAFSARALPRRTPRVSHGKVFPVEIVEDRRAPQCGESSALLSRCRGIRIAVEQDFDGLTLRRLVAALAGIARCLVWAQPRTFMWPPATDAALLRWALQPGYRQIQQSRRATSFLLPTSERPHEDHFYDVRAHGLRAAHGAGRMRCRVPRWPCATDTGGFAMLLGVLISPNQTAQVASPASDGATEITKERMNTGESLTYPQDVEKMR